MSLEVSVNQDDDLRNRRAVMRQRSGEVGCRLVRHNEEIEQHLLFSGRDARNLDSPAAEVLDRYIVALVPKIDERRAFPILRYPEDIQIESGLFWPGRVGQRAGSKLIH